MTTTRNEIHCVGSPLMATEDLKMIALSYRWGDGDQDEYNFDLNKSSITVIPTTASTIIINSKKKTGTYLYRLNLKPKSYFTCEKSNHKSEKARTTMASLCDLLKLGDEDISESIDAVYIPSSMKVYHRKRNGTKFSLRKRRYVNNVLFLTGSFIKNKWILCDDTFSSAYDCNVNYHHHYLDENSAGFDIH
ncbi:hypothetical protein BCR42DRAFT_425442 [Absidia repens]|uniref:Uncharacterized protein n=1 Tax=Absidia repens TaxID=90262 RepID=A0A1X2I2Z5_9FUNG|nr:hypothetical protein BCR42DRAFT_425442 [Absidia repens]